MTLYTYHCADCLECGLESVETLTVEAPNKREADKITLQSNCCDTNEPATPMRYGEGVIETPLGNRTVFAGYKWKKRGNNDFTAAGWVGPACNARVSDLEADARRERGRNLRYWR